MDFKTSKVMIVDDEDMFRKMLRVMLEKIGCTNIHEADCGEDAVALAGKLKPDIILLDISMPDVDGITSAEKIAKISPGSRIVMMTANSSPSRVTASMRAGASNYVIKPFREQQLRSILERM